MMVQFILSFFLFTTPSFAAFECGAGANSKLAIEHLENCHEGAKTESHEEEESDSHQNDHSTGHCVTHCSTNCTHSLALFSVNVSIHLNAVLSSGFLSAEFLYLSPTVESLKRPPIA